MCPEERLLLLHSLPLPSQKKPLLPPAPRPHPASRVPAGKEHQRQGNYLSGSCHAAWRFSPCPKAPLGCHAPGITPAPAVLVLPGTGGELGQGQAEAAEKYRCRKRARFLPEGSSGARRVTRAPAGSSPGTDLNIWLYRESSAQAARVLVHPQSPHAFPPLHPQHRSLQTWLLRAKTSQELQSLGGSSLATRREAGSKGLCSTLDACSRSQLLGSSYPGHHNAALFPAAPGNTGIRKQGRSVPRNTSLQSSGEPGSQAGTPELKAAHASLLPSLLPRSRAT